MCEISYDPGMRVRGDRVLHASHRIILLIGAERHVITVILQQDLNFSVFLLIMAAQHLQIFRQLTHL